jgi:hypothetical protein
MHIVIKAMLIVAGVIHMLPLTGLIGATHLERLYGTTFSEPNLLIMMRHRAVLFGLLGAVMIYAAFRAEIASIAISGGLISAAAFVYLAWSVGGYNTAISRIVIADCIAVVCLAIAAPFFTSSPAKTPKGSSCSEMRLFLGETTRQARRHPPRDSDQTLNSMLGLIGISSRATR